ncbi:MAG: hypothetical protein WC315_09370 [Candidatus Omnitrophota bacterium]
MKFTNDLEVDDVQVLSQSGNAAADMLVGGHTLVKSGTAYTTAVTVQKQRNLEQVLQRCLVEAAIAGDDFYYSWVQGGKPIEGGTVGAALCIARNFGNSAVDVKVDENPYAYIFTGYFIDLETGFNLSRVYRQNKASLKTKDGRDIYTGERGADVIFQIGQSKAIRNVIFNAMPSWLIDRVLRKAKENVIEKFKKMGKEEAKGRILNKMASLKIDLERVEKVYGKPSSWELEEFVKISGAIRSIEDGFEAIDDVFPPVQPSQAPVPEPDKKSAEPTPTQGNESRGKKNKPDQFETLIQAIEGAKSQEELENIKSNYRKFIKDQVTGDQFRTFQLKFKKCWDALEQVPPALNLQGA